MRNTTVSPNLNARELSAKAQPRVTHLRSVNIGRDPRVMISPMKRSTQVVKACMLVRRMLGIIPRSFGSLFIPAFSNLYACCVRPRLEYGRPATSPCTITEMVNLERDELSLMARCSTSFHEGFRLALRLLQDFSLWAFRFTSSPRENER